VCAQDPFGLDSLADFVDLRELRFDPLEELLVAYLRVAIEVNPSDQCYKLLLREEDSHVSHEAAKVASI
jgi:hypothetical protein